MRWTHRCCRRTASTRTAKSCGPGAPTLALSFVDDDPRNDGQKSPVTGESTKETVKTVARGRPVDPSEPVVSTLVCSTYFAREAAGAVGTRLSLRPLFRGCDLRTARAQFAPREGGAAPSGLFDIQIKTRGFRIPQRRSPALLQSHGCPSPTRRRQSCNPRITIIEARVAANRSSLLSKYFSTCRGSV